MTNHRHNFAFYTHVCGRQEHLRVTGIGRAQTNLVPFQIEVLERRFILVVDPSGDHLTVFGPLLMPEDDNISIEDAGVDHGIALHAQSI